MKIVELLEGGWDTTVTQKTVITPNVVKSALKVANQFARDFNQFLDKKGIPGIKIGSPTGSSTYHDVDPEDKVYGDVDLQIIVPELEQTQGMTMSQAQTFWYKLQDEFVKTSNPNYVHQDSQPGHPIFAIGNDQYVQVDLMPHVERLAKWGQYRVTPERGLKGLLYGNMFSVLGELLMMSIQHSGAQIKVRDGQRLPYTPTRKDYELQTVTSNIETFVYDIFKHEAQLMGIKNPQIDPLLKNNPGVKTNDVKVGHLVNAVKGIANSFELNDMYGKGVLSNYTSADDFLNKFLQVYEAKAMKDINASKRDKAETPEAKARAEQDKQKIIQGLELVKGLFQ
jgi:hypothetical protein